MKILYIIPRFHPFKGGAERHFLALAERMIKEGHDVSVYTSKIQFQDESLKSFENYNGIKIYRLWALNKSLYAGINPALLPKLIFNKFDIIHVSGFGFVWTEFCLGIKKLFAWRTKFYNTPHGPFLAFSKGGLRGLIKKVYTLYLRIFIFFVYDKIFAVVPSQKSWMRSEYGISLKKIIVVPNGIDEKYIMSRKPEVKEDDPIILTYLNRMEKYKGIHKVIEAINILKNDTDLSNFKFIIMGRPGGYTKKLLQMVDEYKLGNFVEFKISPSDEERDNVFLKSQISILPSMWEATGIALIEAMAKGNVIITTLQNEAVDLIIKEGVSGFAYEYDDIITLSQILKKLIENFELRKKIILHNVEFAKNFTWEKSLESYVNLVKSGT
ncbi:MAG: glycosyltransferase family 4 protein [Candidatus Dojkabacteria bacterium]